MAGQGRDYDAEAQAVGDLVATGRQKPVMPSRDKLAQGSLVAMPSRADKLRAFAQVMEQVGRTDLVTLVTPLIGQPDDVVDSVLARFASLSTQRDYELDALLESLKQ